MRALRYALQVLQLRHTLGPGVDDQFHVAVVRDKLTRNLSALYPDVLDEVCAAFREYVPVHADADWVPVTAYPIVQKIIARASNRVIVGLPRCECPLGYVR